jgi:hypothetical protein
MDKGPQNRLPANSNATGKTPGAKLSHLVGIGLDHSDGHKRLTQAEKFTIVGGSEETHGKMTETLLRTCDSLRQKGKSLEAASPEEVSDLIRENAERLG